MNFAAKGLRRSLEECLIIDCNLILPLEVVDRLDLLSSRFTRLTDFMIQHIFRLIDQIGIIWNPAPRIGSNVASDRSISHQS
ncbi:MAG: hypothetical protein H0W50_06005 [Parachlamydiaceae bacterium]|nr:hypothetical protein [Parachlamydiaceae bacterium]